MPEAALKIETNQLGQTAPSIADQAPVNRSVWADVTRRIAEGDRQAFATYYETFFETMFRTVRKTSGRDEQTCLDIVHDAMLKAIRGMKPLDSYSHLAAWSTAVAKSVTYDWLRKRLRQTKLESTGAFDKNVANQSDKTIELAEMDAARLLWVEQQLRELPHELQAMISLKYRMGWTLKQIAVRFGIKTGAVDGKIRRAIADLKMQAKQDIE